MSKQFTRHDKNLQSRAHCLIKQVWYCACHIVGCNSHSNSVSKLPNCGMMGQSDHETPLSIWWRSGCHFHSIGSGMPFYLQFWRAAVRVVRADALVKLSEGLPVINLESMLQRASSSTSSVWNTSVLKHVWGSRERSDNVSRRDRN